MKPLQAVIPSLQQPVVTALPHSPIAQVNPPILPLFNEAPPYPVPAYNAIIGPDIIADDESIANVFCFSAFADKITGVVYNDLMGKTCTAGAGHTQPPMDVEDKPGNSGIRSPEWPL